MLYQRLLPREPSMGPWEASTVFPSFLLVRISAWPQLRLKSTGSSRPQLRCGIGEQTVYRPRPRCASKEGSESAWMSPRDVLAWGGMAADTRVAGCQLARTGMSLTVPLGSQL